MVNKAGSSVTYASREVVSGKYQDIIDRAEEMTTHQAAKELRVSGKEIIKLMKDIVDSAEEAGIRKSIGKSGFGKEVDVFIEKYIADEVEKATKAFGAVKAGKKPKLRKAGKYRNDPEQISLVKAFTKTEKRKTTVTPSGEILVNVANSLGMDVGKASDPYSLRTALKKYRKDIANAKKGGKKAKEAAVRARKFDVAITTAKLLPKGSGDVIKSLRPQQRKKRR